MIIGGPTYPDAVNYIPPGVRMDCPAVLRTPWPQRCPPFVERAKKEGMPFMQLLCTRDEGHVGPHAAHQQDRGQVGVWTSVEAAAELAKLPKD